MCVLLLFVCARFPSGAQTFALKSQFLLNKNNKIHQRPSAFVSALAFFALASYPNSTTEIRFFYTTGSLLSTVLASL
jgi:hypothetical protein